MDTIEEIKEKIKSIQSWSWYFEENEFADFYELFSEKYPEVELDEKKIKRIGKALVKGKDIPIDIKEEIQGNNVAFKCTFNDSGFNGRCSEELCKYNWEHGGSWCRDADNPCREGEEFPCMESEIWNNPSLKDLRKKPTDSNCDLCPGRKYNLENCLYKK